MFEIPNRTIKIRSWLPLLAILVCGLTLRILFATGIVRNDEVNYAHAAFELAGGRLHFDTWWQGTTRIGLYIVPAFLYYVFGVHAWTTFFFSFACAVLAMLSVFFIGTLLYSEKAGLAATFLWSVFPLDIFLTGTLRPDGPMAAFCTLSTLFLVASFKKHSASHSWNLVLSLFFLIWALAIKPLALIHVFFFLTLAALYAKEKLTRPNLKSYKANLLKRTASSAFFLVFLFFALSLLILFFVRQGYSMFIFLGETATDAWRLLLLGETNATLARGLNSVAFLSFGPLFLVATIVQLVKKNRSAFVLVWLSIEFIYYELGTVSTGFTYFPIFDFVEARNILFVMIPAVLIAGDYVSQSMKTKQVRQAILVASGITLTTALIYRGVLLLGQTPQWIYFVYGIFIALILVSPSLLNTRGWSNKAAHLTIFALFGITSLVPAPPFHVSYWQAQREYRMDMKIAGSFLTNREGKIFVPSEVLGRDLNLGSDFRLGFSWAGSEEGITRIKAGEATFGDPPYFVISLKKIWDDPSLVLIGEYLNPYKNFYLYRSK
jgi:4-amino-4-deoxy-L-arabinose transferase-like glycosyltransferase